MNSFSIQKLKDNTYFTDKVYLDKTFLLLDPSISLSTKLIKDLTEWRFDTLLTDGVVGINNTMSSDESTEENEKEAEKQSSSDTNLDQLILKFASVKDLSDEMRLSFSRKIYSEYLNFITQIYTRFSTHTELDLGKISEKVKALCLFMKDNSKFILLVTHETDAPSRSYLVDHAMRTMVISIVIGIQLHIPFLKMQELGVTAMLHEIGMIRLPPQLYLTNRIIKPADKKQLTTHPLLGFQILKDANFPLSIQLGTLEHHERENGSGYPRHLTGEKISLYGKIISVACVYDAIVSPRSYKAIKSSHQAILELLKNESHQYDTTVIKALLFSLSLYPIGTYVFLNNGKVAVVTDANPLNFKNPIVQLLGELDSSGKPTIIQTNDTDLKINRILSNEEIDDILKAMKISKK